MRQPLRALLFGFGVVLAILGRAEAVAGTKVTVNFSGTASGTSTGSFSGALAYDQGQSGGNGVFAFTGSVVHAITYRAGSLIGSGVGSGCEPFTITTSGNSGKQFQLVATSPVGTTVRIVLPTTAVIYNSPSLVSLPFCNAFPNPPLTGSTFTLTNSAGTAIYTGNITTISCSPTSTPTSSPATQPPVVVAYVVQPCPQYACPTRSCCLTRIFRRRSCGW